MSRTLVRRCRPLLGSFAEITIAGEADRSTLHAWANQAFALIEEVHRRMSFQDPASDLSRLNAAAPTCPVFVHEWLRRVIRFGCELGHRSGGTFDIAFRSESGSFRDIVFHDDGSLSYRRPLQVDLGGIAKGFAVDLAIEALARTPLEYACVNAGGDLRIHGEGGGVVDIRDPGNPSVIAERVVMTHPAVATSGEYFRKGGDEICRPGTRTAASQGASVSVFAPTCMSADALTKVVVLEDPARVTGLLTAYGAQVIVLQTVEA